MKICLYLELESMLGVSGIGSAIKNQRTALELNGVDTSACSINDDFDLIHINVVGLKSFYLARKLRKQGKKVILHAHVTADDFRDSYRFSNNIAPLLKRYLTVYYSQADLVLCPSEYTKGVLEGYGVRAPIKVISNGIDIDRFQYSDVKRKDFRIASSLEGIVPFSVGHLFIRKGIDTFVNTARRFPENTFISVGRRFKRLEDPRVKKIVSNAPDNVRFMSYVEDIVAAYCGCDIFFFPSYCENQGIVLLEAAACGRPLLVRDIPTYKGWLVDGVTCLKAKNDDEFYAKLKTLILDPNLAKKLGENAFAMSREHSLKNIGAQLKGIYEDLLKK